MRTEKQTPFVNYIWNSLRKILTKGENLASILVAVVGLIYIAVTDGPLYAFKYAILLATFLFSIYFFVEIYILLRYKTGSKNKFTFLGIVLSILLISSSIIITVPETLSMLALSLYLLLVIMFCTYLATKLFK